MPLPGNGTLSLLPAGAGNDSSKKKAMIVRMSAETLDALQGFPDHPAMQFDFSQNPGIHIGADFFPMRPLKETSPHELYLRLASKAKPTAALRLHANVIGKFTVERELGEKVQDRVRDRTLVAEKQRLERKAILLDTPPTDLSTTGSGKKRKASATSANAFRTSVKPRNDPPSSSKVAHSRTPSSTTLPKSFGQPPPARSGLPDTHTRLIHCLALSARMSDEVLRLVAGASASSSSKREVLEILHEVAEQPESAKKGASNANRPWRLKPKSWLDVRPYEWPSFSESERTAVARQARLAFNGMKIPESDEAWTHVRYRNPSNGNGGARDASPAIGSRSTNTPTGSSITGKRRLSSQEVKEQKSKPRQAGTRKAEVVLMKDESLKSRSSGTGEGEEMEIRGSKPDDPMSKRANRRPGSGFKAINAPLQDSGSVSGSTDNQAKSSTTRSGNVPINDEVTQGQSSLPPKAVGLHLSHDSERGRKLSGSSSVSLTMKKGKASHGNKIDVDLDKNGRVVNKRRKPPGSGGESDREGSMDIGRTKKVKSAYADGRDSDWRERGRNEGKEKERSAHHDRDREWQREGSRDTPWNRAIERPDERRAPEGYEKPERQQKSLSVKSSAGAKRKTSEVDDPTYDSLPKINFQKKRKADDGMPSMTSSTAAREPRPRDLSLPKKPELTGLIPSTRRGPMSSRPRIKKEPSPLPPSRHTLPPSPGKTTGSSSSSSIHQISQGNGSSKVNGVSKSRRKSPIYTSSEDEAEPRPPIRHDQASTSVPPTPLPPPNPIRPHQYQLPTNHDTLRKRYRTSWQEYIAIFAKMAAQRSKIEAMLDRTGSVSDSDGDVELMDADELRGLSARHVALREELEGIKQVFDGRG